MKHFLMAALLMTGIATFAQTAVKTEKSEITDLTKPKREKATPESQTKKITEELGLDAKQQVKVKALFEQEAKEKAELKEQRKLATDDNAKAELRVKAKENKIAFNTKMKEILTADQYTKWSARKTKSMEMNENGTGRIKTKSVPALGN